jgi:esterase/lipase superfamily enzyme
MEKQSSRWTSPRLGQEVLVTRWGHYGQPVLMFPTAGGDAEEIERFLMIKALDPLLTEGKIKLYSCDSVAGAAWVSGKQSPEHCSKLQNAFDAFVYRELVPAIRTDCGSADVEIVTTGASIGAFNALASICRHPDVFAKAICISGTYDLTRWLNGSMPGDFYFCSPLHYLPGLKDGEQLKRLRERMIILATGEGKWEDPGQSWRAAQILGAKGIPNRVDAWGVEYDHDWPTWRKMVPHYLGRL